MNKLQFIVEQSSEMSQARAWYFVLNNITVKTPIFMPVGTKATIKWLFLDLLNHPSYRWDLEEINLILANTFHLTLRPWEDLVEAAGGIQRFMNRDRLVLTDSGGFQLFSLWLNKLGEKTIHKKWPLVSLREDGIKFKSPIDGSSHFMSPEDAVDIQRSLWSDIMMMLDVCSPGGSDRTTYAKQLAQTHRRAQRQFDYFNTFYEQSRGVLFPIVQWGTDKKLRQESIDFLSEFARDGIAVGGVSVGESRQDIQDIVEFTWKRLPSNVPRYLMGVGDRETIRHAILSWYDMFDCVMPTRLGRHGVFYTEQGLSHLTNVRFRHDHSMLRPEAKNWISRMYTKAYVHHLLREKEMLWGVILSLHNIFFLHQKIAELREDIVSWKT